MFRPINFPFQFTDGSGGVGPGPGEIDQDFHEVGWHHPSRQEGVKHSVGGNAIGRYIEALRAGAYIWHSDPLAE